MCFSLKRVKVKLRVEVIIASVETVLTQGVYRIVSVILLSRAKTRLRRGHMLRVKTFEVFGPEDLWDEMGRDSQVIDRKESESRSSGC